MHALSRARRGPPAGSQFSLLPRLLSALLPPARPGHLFLIDFDFAFPYGRLEGGIVLLGLTVTALSALTLLRPGIAFLLNGTGLQGILNHPQSLGTLLQRAASVALTTGDAAALDALKAEGRAIAVELMQQLAEIEGISGIHLMAYKQEEWVGEIVTRSGVLGARKPWAPTHLTHLTQSAKA